MRKIINLNDVHRYLPGGYHEVCIEITGGCNAKCKYCPSGSQAGRGIMDDVMFRKIVGKLCQYGIIGKDSQIDLFWWGEPTLNPNLNEIIQVTQEFEAEYVLSTNGSIYKKIEEDNLKNLKRFIISMPGFSQESYDRIHRFDFKTVLDNIRHYVEDFKEAGCEDKIWIAYHIYQFNLDEIYHCYQFCYDLGISFNPGFAFPLLAQERILYAKNKLDEKRKEEMLREIVTSQLDKMIMCSDKKECIYQIRNFVVDEKGNVFGCLNLEHDSSNLCGNLLENDIDEILANIAELSICDECIACGVAPNDMSFKFFYNDWFQMMKIREYYEDNMKDDRMKACLQVMLLLRDFEIEHNISIWDHLKPIMRQYQITDEDIKRLIDTYAMRPCELHDLLKGDNSAREFY